MCNFKSGIVIKSSKGEGYELFMSPWTDSHDEICQLFNLRDTGDNLARVEFSPDTLQNADEIETYRFALDELRAPEWFTEAIKDAVTKRIREHVKNMIVTGDVCLLYGGEYIVSKGANIQRANHCRIIAINGGTISDIRGGTISDISKYAEIKSDNRTKA